MVNMRETYMFTKLRSMLVKELYCLVGESIERNVTLHRVWGDAVADAVEGKEERVIREVFINNAWERLKRVKGV